MELQDIATRLGLALALGFVIGLERGWRERDEKEGQRAAGIRTFSLIGLLGGLFATLSPGSDHVLLAAGFIATSTVMGAFIWREHAREGVYGATTMIAALVTFVLGAVAVLGDMRVAAGAGVVTVGLLAYKSTLHGFLARITSQELRSALLLAAMTFIALPLLPDHTVDPWGAINPHQLWLITILIAAVSFVGYIAVKLVGPSRGLVLAAAMGGLVSSTVVTLTLARLARDNAERLGLLSGSILAAGAVMMVRVLVLAGVINLSLAVALAVPLLAAAAFQGVAAWFLIGREGHGSENKPEVLKFGAILGVVMLAAGISKSLFGDSGLMAVAAISGLADVDALTLSVANMGPASPVGVRAVLLCIGINTIAKSFYAGVAGGTKIGITLFLFNMAAMVVAVIGYVLVPSLHL